MKWSSNKDVVWLAMRLWWRRCETVSDWDSLTLVPWLALSPALHTYMDNSRRHSPQSSTTWVTSELLYLLYLMRSIPSIQYPSVTSLLEEGYFLHQVLKAHILLKTGGAMWWDKQQWLNQISVWISVSKRSHSGLIVFWKDKEENQ